ncbi:MAG: hypothetical protein AAGJ83_09625, partial [Planctomycetota bacterium]
MARPSAIQNPTRKHRKRPRRKQRRHTFQRLEDRRVLASILWDGDAGTSDWFTATNWVGNQLPTKEDDVVIPARSSVQIGRDISVNELRIEPEASVLVGVDGTDPDLTTTLDAQIFIEGNLTGRLAVELVGSVRVTETGQLRAAGFSSDSKTYTYAGNSHIRVDGDFVNQGHIQIVSGDIDFRHPCCGGARAEIEIAEGSALVNQGRIGVEFPIHGRRLNDIAYKIDGDVVNEGVVELGFHLFSRDHTFINRGEVRISDYESDGTIHDSIWNVEDAVLLQDGGQILGDGRATFTDSEIRLAESWTIDSDSANFSIIRTDVMPLPESRASLSIAEGRGQLF